MADDAQRYPDRFLFGTDTVAPAGPAPYFAVFDLWAPVWRLLTPEASLKASQEQLRADLRRRKAQSPRLGKSQHQVTAFIRFHKQETRTCDLHRRTGEPASSFS